MSYTIEGSSGPWETVIGRPFDEETVFAVASAIERAAGFDALPALRAGETL